MLDCVLMTQGASWSEALHARIAQAIRNARAGQRMSAQQLADETERLGYAISRSQIANYESGRKQGLDVAELTVIAAALRVPPVTLLFGGPPDEAIEVLPDEKGPSVSALAWFVGDRKLAWPGTELELYEARDQANAAIADPDSPALALLDLIRERAEKHREIHVARWALGVLDKDSQEFGRALERIGTLAEQIDTTNLVIDAFVSEGDEQ